MRAGLLDRVITIQRATETLDEAGVPSTTWSTIATLRAQIKATSTSEFIAGYGAEARDVTTFRTRWFAGLTTADQVTFDGRVFDIKGLAEIGRREGLEIRAVARS